jgi:hypothetical protein
MAWCVVGWVYNGDIYVVGGIVSAILWIFDYKRMAGKAVIVSFL